MLNLRACNGAGVMHSAAFRATLPSRPGTLVAGCKASHRPRAVVDEQQQAAVAPSEPSTAPQPPEQQPTLHVSARFTAKQREYLWNSVRKELLKLGQRGAQSTHISSLRSLLEAHTLVKVKLNGVYGADLPQHVDLLAAQLVEGTGSELVLAKGSTLLFARGDTAPDAVMSSAQASEEKRLKSQAEREEQRQEQALRLAAGPPPPTQRPSRPRKGTITTEDDEDDAEGGRRQQRKETLPKAPWRRRSLGMGSGV